MSQLIIPQSRRLFFAGEKLEGRRKPLDLGHSAYDHQGEAGRHSDGHFDFDR
jgi:hypothetical protein